MRAIKQISSTWDKIELYVISLWLLFLLIIIATVQIPIYFGKDAEFIGTKKLISLNIVPLLAFLMLALGAFFLSRFKYKLKGSKKTFTITNIQNGNYEHLTFLTTYIVPLISLNLGEIRNVIILFLLLIAIGGICIKTHMFYANPTLALLGFHIYIVSGGFRTGERDNFIVVTRDQISLGDIVKYRRLDEKIYYARLAK
ncbi:anti-phage protein KwaA [Paenibacillus radicis (ex Xue et al. 2023)]|uniref:Uncharacterized protein n=1 Tax=Paenibacillus radicis (ex Xue et al. 2023) TaxID=2972489 RepID=A0ABT1YD68_9BACL|nr:anti-phage protein KwaA [Paenibacillus radicis (ex Xue et al. 2023)]MCR8630710.1 hypothetical protein [Paenibacillus radicis (ex Xue et al. 2023)]